MILFKMSQVLIGQALAAVTEKVSFQDSFEVSCRWETLLFSFRLIERVVGDTLVSSFTRTMAGMTLFNISRDKRSSLAFKYKQNLLNFDHNLSHTGELWLQSFVVQISCSELYWFVFRVKCGSSLVGTTPRSWIVLGCASRLWRDANERAKYVTTFEGHATRNRAEYLLSSRIHTRRAHLARFLVFRRI